MKLYLRDGNVFDIKEDLKLEFTNLEGFKEVIIGNSGHVVASLKYRVFDSENSYFGETTFDTYKKISSHMDETSPYKVEVVNFENLDKEDACIEISLN